MNYFKWKMFQASHASIVTRNLEKRECWKFMKGTSMRTIRRTSVPCVLKYLKTAIACQTTGPWYIETDKVVFIVHNAFRTKVFFPRNTNYHIRSDDLTVVDYAGGEAGNPQLTCPVCWKVFKEFSCLKVHLRDIHERQEKQVCDICLRVFKSINTLRNHKSLYHKGDSRNTSK